MSRHHDDDDGYDVNEDHAYSHLIATLSEKQKPK